MEKVLRGSGPPFSTAGKSVLLSMGAISTPQQLSWAASRRRASSPCTKSMVTPAWSFTHSSRKLCSVPTSIA